MGNFIAWLLGIPAGALVLAYVAICASILSAKRRMAGHDTRRHQPAGIMAFRSRASDAIGHPEMMMRRGG
jgi:hypothetical protein